MIKFNVVGKPIGKKRPFVTKSGHAFTPEESVTYEELVKYSFLKEVGQVLKLERRKNG